MSVCILQDKKTGRYYRDQFDDGVRSKRAKLEYRWVEDMAEASAYTYKGTVKTLAKLLPQYNMKIIERN